MCSDVHVAASRNSSYVWHHLLVGLAAPASLFLEPRRCNRPTDDVRHVTNGCNLFRLHAPASRAMTHSVCTHPSIERVICRSKHWRVEDCRSLFAQRPLRCPHRADSCSQRRRNGKRDGGCTRCASNADKHALLSPGCQQLRDVRLDRANFCGTVVPSRPPRELSRGIA